AVHRHTLVGSPVVHPITSAARSTDNAVASENEQLTKLNESLLKLSHDFDTLRLESRTAVRQLADDFNQTESAAELLDELRQTLIDHRHLLANNTQSHPLPVTRIAQQPGPVENPDPFEGNNSPIPESADTEQILPHSDNPDNSDQRNNFEVPLPPQAKKQLSADVIWETFVSGHGAEKSERNNQTPGSRVLSKATHDMLTSERTPRDTATAPVAGIHDKPLIVSKPAINSEDSRASSLMPVKDGPSQQESAVVLVPELPDVADRETEPVVYEQTFNFVLPPATNPLPEVQRPDTEKEESLDILPPVAPEKPTTPRDSAPAVPESSTESRKLIQKDARQKPKRITRNQRNRKSLQPKLFFQTQESSTAHVDRQPIIRTTHAQNQLRNDVSRRPHHKSPEYAHQHSSGTSKLVDQPTLLHRLRSSLLAAGRKRTID
ncbi:MAG: hypothetical protein MK102_17505, partial [Fuerstiella sp.]|nr:hypothetical protein [Fuerstiella sp.]